MNHAVKMSPPITKRPPTTPPATGPAIELLLLDVAKVGAPELVAEAPSAVPVVLVVPVVPVVGDGLEVALFDGELVLVVLDIDDVELVDELLDVVVVDVVDEVDETRKSENPVATIWPIVEPTPKVSS